MNFGDVREYPAISRPPARSFLEALFEKHQVDAGFSAQMEFSSVKRWTAHLCLHEEFQHGLRAYRSALQELDARNKCSKQNCMPWSKTVMRCGW
jgi:hypothetical protein